MGRLIDELLAFSRMGRAEMMKRKTNLDSRIIHRHGGRITLEDVRHFKVLDNLKMDVGHGGVICLAGQLLPLTGSASSIPVSVI